MRFQTAAVFVSLVCGNRARPDAARAADARDTTVLNLRCDESAKKCVKGDKMK
jgi:hypothetical protein